MENAKKAFLGLIIFLIGSNSFAQMEFDFDTHYSNIVKNITKDIAKEYEESMTKLESEPESKLEEQKEEDKKSKTWWQRNKAKVAITGFVASVSILALYQLNNYDKKLADVQHRRIQEQVGYRNAPADSAEQRMGPGRINNLLAEEQSVKFERQAFINNFSRFTFWGVIIMIKLLMRR